MTSFVNLTGTSAGASASHSPPGLQAEHNLDQIISRLIRNISPVYNRNADTSSSAGSICGRSSALQPTSSSEDTNELWMPPTTNLMPPIGTRDFSASSSNSSNQLTDNSSGSPGTASSSSLLCFRCDNNPPTVRCHECNELYCTDCGYLGISSCQVNNHTLFPIHNISTNVYRCTASDIEGPNEPFRYFCLTCKIFINSENAFWAHKGCMTERITAQTDFHRLGIYKLLEDVRHGQKAIKSAIDIASNLFKTCEKEAAEAKENVKKTMLCLSRAVEERERQLIEKVEQNRTARAYEINDHLQTLRGMLAALAHINDDVSNSCKVDGIDLAAVSERRRSQVNSFAATFRNTYVEPKKILFIKPNYEVMDQIRRSGEAIMIREPIRSANSSSNSNQSSQSFLTNQPAAGPVAPPMNYMPSNNQRSLTDYSQNRTNQYYELNVTSSNFQIAGGYGQAIPGSWLAVNLRPTRSIIPGIPMITFGKEGQDEGQVSRPWGLCVDREGNIIVADRRNNRIQIFNGCGEFITMFGSKGTGPGEFDLPAGITTDAYGRIVVIDKDNHRVQIFSASGNFVLKFGSFGKENGQFQYPWDVAVNSLGNIVVTDTRNHRIQLFTSEGAFITKFVFEGANPAKLLKGPTTPRGVCFTTTGNIIVSDFENHRLLMVDPLMSKVLHCVGREGSNVGELNRPSGIVTDDEGRIVVADSKNHRVLVFSSELHILHAVDLKSPGLDDKDRPSDVALTPDGYLVVLFETLPDTARDVSSHGKQYIKIY